MVCCVLLFVVRRVLCAVSCVLFDGCPSFVFLFVVVTCSLLVGGCCCVLHVVSCLLFVVSP